MGNEEQDASIETNFSSIDLKEIPLDASVKYPNWSLEEVLKYSDEKASGLGSLEVRTIMSGVLDKKTQIKFSDNSLQITFSVGETDIIRQTITSSLEKNGYDNAFIDNDGTLSCSPDRGVNISIQDRVGQEGKKVTISLEDSADPLYDIQIMGLRTLLKNTDAPNTALEAGSRGLIEFADGRVVPVSIAESTEEIKDKLLPPKDNRKRVYHGTSYSAAVGISRLGLFGTDPDRTEHPTLAENFNNEVLATAESRAEGVRGYGAILVIDCEEDEYQNLGGYGESIGTPKRKYDVKNRSNLKYALGSHLANDPNLRYMPPERVSQIILVPKPDVSALV